MASRGPATVTALLAKLPAARRKEVERVRDAVRGNLPAGYEEAVANGMLVYQVPREVYPDTYNGQPLWYAALAAHKSYLTLYLMSAYGHGPHLERLKDGFRAAGKKLDMGKSCIHFKTADDLPLDVIGELIADIPMETWVATAKAARRR